jgi:formylglycine-generating enzyme required for sulfatase activity
MKKIYLLTSLFLCQLGLAQTRGLYVPDGAGVTLAQNEKRVALVIGNKSYKNWDRLTNPVNDAHLMATVLSECGFSVTELSDVNKDAMIEGIEAFAARISGPETVALFFYAGHGIEAFGKNYLIPTSDNSKCRDDLSVKSIELDYIQRKLSAAAMTIMVIDACRNNNIPFTCAGERREGGKQGFIKTEPEGIFIGFSTSPGTTALDGTPQTQNSPYTAALATAIRNSTGEEIESVFKAVHRHVKLKGQIPWQHSGYSGKFLFKPAVLEPPRDKDTDGDGILDRMDNCPNERGPLTNNGCPVREERDSDGDGIADNVDRCPYEKGSREYNGCPPPKPAKSDFTESATGTSFAMKYLTGNSFKMGSEDGESDEKPVHTVRVSDFHMGKYEVTVGEYLKFCQATNSNWPEWLEKDNSYHIETGSNKYYYDKGYRRKGSETLPIVGVNWENAVAYCKWLSSTTGKTYRLPTEAEWEYAARGGEAHPYAGSRDVNETAWYDNNSGSNPHPVGQKKANGFGLHDMSGNVWEWCADWYDSNFYSNSAATAVNPANSTVSTTRVLRGGSWLNYASLSRVANRFSNTPTNRDYFIGFRVVCVL